MPAAVLGFTLVVLASLLHAKVVTNLHVEQERRFYRASWPSLSQRSSASVNFLNMNSDDTGRDGLASAVVPLNFNSIHRE